MILLNGVIPISLYVTLEVREGEWGLAGGGGWEVLAKGMMARRPGTAVWQAGHANGFCAPIAWRCSSAWPSACAELVVDDDGGKPLGGAKRVACSF